MRLSCSFQRWDVSFCCVRVAPRVSVEPGQKCFTPQEKKEHREHHWLGNTAKGRFPGELLWLPMLASSFLEFHSCLHQCHNPVELVDWWGIYSTGYISIAGYINQQANSNGHGYKASRSPAMHDKKPTISWKQIGWTADPSRHSSQQIISRWTGHRVVSLCRGQRDSTVNRHR